MIRYSFFIFLSILLIACSENRLDVDVTQEHIHDVTIDRLEQDLFKPNLVSAKLNDSLKAKYGSIYFNFQQIVNENLSVDSQIVKGLNRFVHDTAMHEAYLDCVKEYPDLDNFKSELTTIFKHFKFHFPQRVQPRIITFMSGFNYSILAQDSTIGIGLEMYLGEENKFYRMLQFPKYKTMTMNRNYMVSDFARGWMITEFPNAGNNKNLLDEIIYNGKILYLIDALLPALDDTIKIGYTQKQLDWCETNDYNMWAYFVQKKVLYISDPSEIIKYTGEGPFTSAFNKDSPSRVGTWIGWQIVRAYMNRYEEVTLEELMKESDAQKILFKSKYKPGK